MFYVDLDALDDTAQQMKLLKYGQAGLYSIHDQDYLPGYSGTIKERALQYLKSKKIDIPIGKIMLLTNFRVLGYVFNPVSFYFCYDQNGSAICAIAEVGNTFDEHKPYLIEKNELGSLRSRQAKEFYVSPFSDLNFDFIFKLEEPSTKLLATVDTYDGKLAILITSLTGMQVPLSDASILKLSLKYPLVTLRIIFLIHFHALILLIKGVSFHEKDAQLDQQKGVLRPYRSQRKSKLPVESVQHSTHPRVKK